MSVPIRNLPVMQNWDCHSCSDCCRIEAVITEEEKRRIEALDLANDPEVAPKPWFAPVGRDSKKWKLTHRPDGGCVFLTTGNRCRIQERFGADIKPFVCRLFPFVLIPAGNHWRVGMRFSCPSAAANSGRPVADAEKDLVHLSHLLEQHVGRSANSAPPPLLQAGQQLSWPDVCRVVQVLVEIVQDRSDRLERRLRKCLAVARVCGQTHLDRLQGNQLSEYLAGGAQRRGNGSAPRRRGRAAARPAARQGPVPRPAGHFCPQGSRRVRGPRHAGDGWAECSPAGDSPGAVVPCLGSTNSCRKPASRRSNDRSGTPPEMDETLERYYVVKLNSLQFCGPPNFDLPLWAGLESLVLTLPMILWLRRAFADLPPVKAVEQAIQLVDDHFGGNPMLGFPHIQHLMRLLAQRGELEKLVAWYSR